MEKPHNVPLETVLPLAFAEFGGQLPYERAKGYEAEAAIINNAPEPYVVKVLPGLTAKKAAHTLQQEAVVLAHLQATKDCPVSLPRLWAVDDNPCYIVQSKVGGTPLSPTPAAQTTATASLPDAAQRQLGTDLGTFMAWQQYAFTPHDYQHGMRDADTMYPPLDPFNYEEAFRTNMASFSNRLFPSLTVAAAHAWRGHGKYYPDGSYMQGNRINHFDLQGQNITTEDGRLKGVYDWVSASIGVIEQELRGPYLMGSLAFEAAVSELARHNIHADPDHAAWYARARIINVLCYCVKNRLFEKVYQECVTIIKSQMPEEDWSELDRPNHV